MPVGVRDAEPARRGVKGVHRPCVEEPFLACLASNLASDERQALGVLALEPLRLFGVKLDEIGGGWVLREGPREVERGVPHQGLVEREAVPRRDPQLVLDPPNLELHADVCGVQKVAANHHRILRRVHRVRPPPRDEERVPRAHFVAMQPRRLLSEKGARLHLAPGPLCKGDKVGPRGRREQKDFPPARDVVPDGAPAKVKVPIGVRSRRAHEGVEQHFGLGLHRVWPYALDEIGGVHHARSTDHLLHARAHERERHDVEETRAATRGRVHAVPVLEPLVHAPARTRLLRLDVNRPNLALVAHELGDALHAQRGAVARARNLEP
mmetsp:Transcript_14447/g.47433  ORF Transcript_14447/g.47433 Transcript_14447/m.47433 type:complete len:324 (+) Transcript_14447:2057-3028(+)